MGSKFASLHIRAEQIDEQVSVLNPSLEDLHISVTYPGWVSVYSDSLTWGTTFPVAKNLSKLIESPIVSVEYFDDDLIEVHVVQAGKKVTSMIYGNGLEEYGLKAKRFKIDKLNEILSLKISKEELEWVRKELNISDLCDYLQIQMNVAFRRDADVKLLTIPKTPWNTGVIKQAKAKLKEKKFRVCSWHPGSLAMAFITSEKELYTWGDKNYGVLGDDSIKNRKKPEKILDNIIAASLGSYSAYAIDIHGALYGWGEHSPHQTSTPKKMPLQKVKQVGVRARDVYVLLESGELYGFGQNAYEQLGHMKDGKSDCILSNVNVIDSDGYSVHAITNAGDLYIWRNEQKDQRGRSSNQLPQKEFEHVIQAVQAHNFVYALTDNGELYAWGRSGAYYNSSYYEESYSPTKIFEKVKKIAKDMYRIYVLFESVN